MIKSLNNLLFYEKSNELHDQFGFINKQSQLTSNQMKLNLNFKQSNHNKIEYHHDVQASEILLKPNNPESRNLDYLHEQGNGQNKSKNNSSRISTPQNCILNQVKNIKNHSQGKINRQLLLQKKKSYAQNIREKNKLALQQKAKKQKSRISINSKNDQNQKNQQTNNNSCIIFKDSSIKNLNQKKLIFDDLNGQDKLWKINSYSKSKGKNKTNQIFNTIQISTKKFKQNKQNVTNQKQVMGKNSKKQNVYDIFQTSNNQLLQKKCVMNLLLKNHNIHKRQTSQISSFVNKRLQFTKVLEKQSLSSMKLDALNQSSLISQINDFTQIAISASDNINTELNQVKYSQKLHIVSNVLKLAISVPDQFEKLRIQEQKQINLLKKQNGTFKKELASFRKQNSTLKKQLQQSKKNAIELQQKSQKFIQKYEQLVKELQKTNHVNQQKANLINQQKSNTNGSCLQLNNFQEILNQYKTTLFYTKNHTQALELKIYMLQKRFYQEQQASKKRLALQISNWRNKYNKLRNEHLSVKKLYINFNDPDESIDMDISRDQ